MDTQKKRRRIAESIEKKSAWLCGLSDAIWDHPELAFREYFAKELLCDALLQEGFAVEAPVGGLPTAFLGRYGHGKPVIGILGEYDALAGLSQQADVPEPRPLVPRGSGHGCGHNLLGVGSLAAAIAVKEYLEDTGLPGTVVYFGCPAEEGGSGKAFLVRAGVFRDVDCALTWHPENYHAAAPHSTLANQQIRYAFSGISAHASASPERGRSALDALTLMNTGVQFLREHVPSTTRIHYAVVDTGGTSPNVVQATASAVYLIRTPSADTLPEIVERVNKVARGAAMMTETEVEITLQKACANMVPNRVLCSALSRNLHEMGMPELTQQDLDYASRMKQANPPSANQGFRRLREFGPPFAELVDAHWDEPIHNLEVPEVPGMATSEASTDVGDVSWVCPTGKVQICTMCSGTGGHTWQRTAQGKSGLAHKGMLYAGRVLAGTAVDLLATPQLLEKAKREWETRLRGKTYVPLPAEVQPNE